MIKVILLQLYGNIYSNNFQRYRKLIGKLKLTFPKDTSLLEAVSGPLVWNHALNWDSCTPWLWLRLWPVYRLLNMITLGD